jgi:putative Holliday junction resolvase
MERSVMDEFPGLETDLKAVPRDGRLLGIDYGQKRIGLAQSDPMQFLASSLKTLDNRGWTSLISELVHLIRDNQIVAVVIGLPLHMSGDLSEKASEILTFSEHMKKRIDVPIFFQDERWSTRDAHQALHAQGKSPSRNRKSVDQIAAAFILQGFLDHLRTCRNSVPPPTDTHD